MIYRSIPHRIALEPIGTGYSKPMVTVLRADGLRVVIYANDHVPAYVHVFGDGEAKINLIGPHGVPDLVWPAI